MSAFCVYCASSQEVDPQYIALAAELGAALARAGHTTVYGGCNVGLMHSLAESALREGGKVLGIIPEVIYKAGCAYHECTRLIVTSDMRERKAMMEKQSDGFVVLPGGFGTLEEFFEIVTHKQLGLLDKPIVILNHGGFYNRLLEQLEHCFSMKFAREAYRTLYTVCSSVQETLAALESYRPGKLKAKYPAGTAGRVS